MRLFREPDAGDPPVRFDEREQETESSQTGLRRAGRKPSPIATGRLQPLRLIVIQEVRFEEEISTAVAGPRRCENLCAGIADEVFWGLPTMAARRRPTATSGCAKHEMF